MSISKRSSNVTFVKGVSGPHGSPPARGMGGGGERPTQRWRRGALPGTKMGGRCPAQRWRRGTLPGSKMAAGGANAAGSAQARPPAQGGTSWGGAAARGRDGGGVSSAGRRQAPSPQGAAGTRAGHGSGEDGRERVEVPRGRQPEPRRLPLPGEAGNGRRRGGAPPPAGPRVRGRRLGPWGGGWRAAPPRRPPPLRESKAGAEPNRGFRAFVERRRSVHGRSGRGLLAGVRICCAPGARARCEPCCAAGKCWKLLAFWAPNGAAAALLPSSRT